MTDEPVKYCHRCGMPVFISPIAYKGDRDNPHYWHHGCYNMEIRDETVKAQKSGFVPRSLRGQAQEC